MQKRILATFILMILSLTSCGDLFMTDKNDSGFGSKLLGATCKFDSEAFSRILEENIKGDIRCLESKIDIFLRFVKTDRPGFISQKTLLEVLETDIVDLGDEDIKPLVQSIFDLSFIIFGGDKGYIAENDYKSIIELIVYFNEQIVWKVYDHFVSKKEVNYNKHLIAREDVYGAMILISSKLTSLMNSSRGNRIDRINTEGFIDNFFGDDEAAKAKINSMMFLKRVFLGGEKFELTNKEIEDAVDKLPELMLVALDLVKSEHFIFRDDLRKMLRLYNKDAAIVKGNLFYDVNSDKSLFTIYEMFDAVEQLAPSLGDPDQLPEDETAFLHLRKFPREIVEIKRIITNREYDSGAKFDTRDLFKILEHAQNIFDESEYFYKMYTEYQDELDSDFPISLDFSDFPAHTETEEEYRTNFGNIAYNYKYFKGSSTSPVFGFAYKRNPAGLVEVRALEYLMTQVMKTYGEEDQRNARGGYHMKLDEHAIPLINKLKRLLKEFGLVKIGRKYKRDRDGNIPTPAVSPEVVSTSENLVLMSTLFQNQSNGCDSDDICMEVPEITEFFVGVLTAISVKDSFNKIMKQECGKDVDEFGRFKVNCFKNKFITVLETELEGDAGKSLSDYMPLLYSFVKELTVDLEEGEDSINSKKFNEFISETDAFTRTCSGTMVENQYGEMEELAMTENDAFGIFAGLLNVESTLLRFDVNENNRMDDGCDDRFLRKYKICKKSKTEKNEVMMAYYEVYEGAIQGLVAPNGGFMKNLAKSIFQYLIKFGKVPDTGNFNSLWDYAKFLVRINKKANATRTTVATILKTLGEQSDNAKTYPFKCDDCAAGDPNVECLPDDGVSWEYDWQLQELDI